MPFSSLGLAPELVRAVADAGYQEPTPVQRQAIPLILAGRDLIAAAQTGTGKTAAFVLPMLQRLHSSMPRPAAAPAFSGSAGRPLRDAARRPVRALILAPTRELSIQIEEAVRVYGRHRPAGSAAIYGGVGFEPQARALRAGRAVVVATPGRLLDHVEQRTIDLSSVEILVLDEADRMLDMGFIRDIRRVIALLPAARQNLLFSATLSDEIRGLAAGLLDRPAAVDVTPRVRAAELVDQVVIPVDRHRKTELLSHLVRSGRLGQALVFTRTKHAANRLAEQLERDGIHAAAIHGNKSQSQRIRALGDFKSGKVDVLVATDIAARGIDIDALPHVVNYELPTVPADYVHRIGRTGRAGIDGHALSLVCVDETDLLRDIERILRTPIAEEIVPGFEPDRTARREPIRLRSDGGPSRSGPPASRRRAFRPAPAVAASWRPPMAGTHERDRGSALAPHPRAARAGAQASQGTTSRVVSRPVALPGERLRRAASPGTGSGDTFRRAARS